MIAHLLVVTVFAAGGPPSHHHKPLPIEDAGIKPNRIDYLNAHGSSTRQNDVFETSAYKMALGEHAYKVPISGTKSMIGHLIAAAGVTGLIVTIQTLRTGVVHPTINYETPDPDCDLDYVPNVAREARVEHALTNAFGFGGQNISLVVSRFVN